MRPWVVRLALLLGLAVASVTAQTPLLNETKYTQNFDGLGTGNITVRDLGSHNTALTNWFFEEAGSNSNNTMTAGTGSSNSGDSYNFGTNANANRAIGGLQSGSLNPIFGAFFSNANASAITSLRISYTGETWRVGAASRADRLDFQYSTNATYGDLHSGTWIDFNNLDYANPGQATGSGSIQHIASISNEITGLNIGSGAKFAIRWTDFDATSSDDGMAVDNFAITAVASAPDVQVKGNGVVINDGDTTPSTADDTDFGIVGLNQSNLVRTFTITNSGTASLTVDNVRTTGTAAVDFIIVSQPGTPVAAGATTTFQVKFDPTATGTRTATITFSNNVAGAKNPYTFDVQGTGVAAGVYASPSPISVTTMVGTAIGTQNFGVTNVGRGRLDYSISTNANWLSVSPVSANLAETAGQQETITFSVTGLYAGSSNATITVSDAGASNTAQVAVTLVLTNIPDPLAVAVTNDGAEMTRLSWTKHASYDVLIVYRATNDPSAPVNGTTYNLGDPVGSDGTRVVYTGNGSSLEHCGLPPAASQNYAFYSINNDHYSPGLATAATTTAYLANEIVEPFSYTNGLTLNGQVGGHGFSNTWSIGAGTWTNEPYSLNVETNYPQEYGNKIRMKNAGDGGQSYATRSFAPFVAGQVYVAWIMSYQYAEDYRFAGISLMSNTSERAFIGKIPDSSWYGLGVSRFANSTDTKRSSPEYELHDFNSDTGNIYLVVAAYDFDTQTLKAKAFYKTATVPDTEPATWDVSSNFPPGHIDMINGIRLAAGALGGGDGTIGDVLFDEVRVATNWSEILNEVALPEIAVLGTNDAVITTANTPDAANGTTFGDAAVAGGTVDRTFAITNLGTSALTVSGISTSGANAADFIVTSPTFPMTVTAGTHSNFVVRFDPLAAGERTATITVSSDDLDESSYDFYVNGTGTLTFVTLANQGFEGGASDTWAYSFVPGAGGYIYVDDTTNAAGAYAATLRGSTNLNADPYIEFAPIDVNGYGSVTLSVAFAFAGPDTGDDLDLQLSYDDGATWTGPGSVTLVSGVSNTNLGFGGTSPITVGSNPWEVTLPSTATHVRVRLLFDESANNNTFDRYFIDEVKVTGAGAGPYVQFGDDFYTVAEEDGTLTIPVQISSSADATVRVFSAGTATEGGGNDFTFNSTDIVFTAGGSTTSNLVLTINNDASPEGLEDLLLRLADPSGAYVAGPAVASVLIQDDETLSIMSANLTSGTNYVSGALTYDETGQRILKRLRADVVAIQEWVITNASYRDFVDANFGTNYSFYVEPESDPNPIPNGVISRYPIIASNEWADSYAGDRDYVHVTIDVPGGIDLHVVSVHLKAGYTAADEAEREDEARELTNYIAGAGIPAGDYLAVCGDFNLSNLSETAYGVITNIVSDLHRPADQYGVTNSSLGKTHPFDHVFANSTLDLEHRTLPFAGFSYPEGMIFDSEQFTDHLLPALVADSYATNRAHHAVMRLFTLTTSAVPPTVTTTVATGTNETSAASGGNVTASGGAAVTNLGVVWNTTGSPVPGTDAASEDGSGTGSFSSTLTNLTPGQTYYYRAYAQNSAGTGYGTAYTLTTPCFSGVVTGLYASVTNDTDFTAAWSNVAGATGFQLDVSTNSEFGSQTLATDLFISEYIEGSSNEKYIELFNGTGSDVDLADYALVLFANGTTTPTASNVLSGTLTSGSVVIYKNSSATNTLGTANTAVNFNGDDAVALWNRNSSSWADIFGRIGEDPGSAWTDGSFSTQDKTLVRKSSVTGGVTSNPGSGFPTLGTEWDQYDTSDESHLNAHTFDGGSSPDYIPGYSNRVVSTTSQSVTGLTSGVTYYFRVRATNEFCTTANSSTAMVTTAFVSPGVSVLGNGTTIADGSTAPSTADDTDFGRVGLINSNIVHTFTITNSGLGTLTIENVVTNGTAAADFVIVSQPSSPVSAGGTTTFQVRFDPTAAGTRTATLLFTNNVTGSSPYDFVVQGTGVAAGIVYGPSSINLTTMVGTTPSTENIGITNGGLGQLIYAIGSNVNWLSVSPSGATLSETETQQHTVTFDVTGLGAGTSNATITITDANASNSPQAVAVSLVLTNIPDVTANLATNDGAELVRVSWTPMPALDVLVVYNATNAPAVPTPGTFYADGAAVGSDGSRVVYKGGGSYLDHVVQPGTAHYYTFYSINNDYYSPGVTSDTATTSYGPAEQVEPFAYTNGVSLDGLDGGNLFTSAWSIGVGNFTVLSNGPAPNLYVSTNYPASAAQRVVISNYVNNTEMTALRQFAAVTSGTLYVSYIMSVEYGGYGHYTGLRLMSNSTERMFVGEAGGDDLLGIDGYGGSLVNSSFNINSFGADTGNVYLVVARFDFSTLQIDVTAYYRTTAVPEAEPGSWEATATASGDRTWVDGIELVTGGFGNNQNGLVAFDEIRIATNWAGLIPPSGTPGIEASPTNIVVSVMRGSNPPDESFAVTNVGAGVLAYDVSTNFNWLTVSPVSGNLAGGVGQQHTVSIQAAALPPGTNIGTITIADAGASNTPQTVRVNVVVTNIPPPTDVVAAADGYEMVRLGWTPPASLNTLILHDDAPIATDPSQGTAYNVGDSIGLATVIFNGSGSTLEHIVQPGTTNYYAFYSVNNNYYSSVSTNDTIDCPDPSATNLVAGDIAIYGMMTRTTGTPPNDTNYDSFGFVPLIDLPEGTEIKFTDNGWHSNGTFRATEGILTWRATNCIPAGTAIRWVATNNPPVTEGAIVATNGTFAPNIEGEQILAYQGDESTPVFIYALASHTNGGFWYDDATDSHSSALPTGLTNGLTAIVIAELNNVVLDTNQLSIIGDRNAILSFIGSTNNWIGDDETIFDLLSYDFSFPDVNASGGGVATSVVMGVYRTNEIVDAFAYTNGVSMSSPVRDGGHGWTQEWVNVAGTWAVLSNNHDEVSFPVMDYYPTNAANFIKLTDPTANNTGRLERGFAPYTNGSVYIAAMLAYQYEGFDKFAGISFLSGGSETGFIGKVSDPTHSFTFGIDTYGGSRQFAAYDLRGLENATDNTYLVIGRYDFATMEIRGQAYYRPIAVPTTEPSDWAVTATVSGAGIPLIDGIRIHAGGDNGGTIGNAYFDEVRVAATWGALLNRNPPTVETRPVTNIQPAAAVGGGNVTSDGGLTVTNRGVVWTTNGTPTVADSSTSDGTGTGLYSSTLTGLTPGETYYVRAYAQNAAGTAYGGLSNFTAACFTSVVTGLYVDPTNATDFTVHWSALAGATGYRLDVSSDSGFASTGTDDDFTDGNFTASPAWSGDTASFSILTATPVPSGSAASDGSYLGAVSSVGNAILMISSTETSLWQFSLASPDFDPSSANHFGVVLMSDTAITGDATTNLWNGYYLRLGVDGATDYLELWRSSGATKTKIGDYSAAGNFGTGALKNGLDLQVARSAGGVFTLSYATGFTYASTPAGSGGSLTDTTYAASSYFGVYSRFANPSTSRRVYIDNIHLAGVNAYVSGYYNRSVSGTSESVTGVLAGVTYYYRVTAVTPNCTSDPSSTGVVTTVDTVGPQLYGFNVYNRTNTDAMIRNGFAVTGVVWDAGSGVSNGAATPYYLIRNNVGTIIAVSNKFTTAPANGTTVPAALSGTFAAVPLANVTLGTYTSIVGAADRLGNSSTSNFPFTVIDDDANPPEQVTLNSTNNGGGNLRFMQISIGANNITLGSGSTTNLVYPTTDGALAGVVATNPLSFWIGAADTNSGLNRGTSDPSTNMNLTIDSITVSNTANFDASRSSSFTSTTNARATNVWTWTTAFTGDQITTLITNTVNGLGTNRITASMYDADGDRLSDSLSLIDRQYGYLVVTDDDTVPPVVSAVTINGFGVAGSQTAIFTETMGTAGSSGESIAVHETNNRFDNTAFTMSGTGDMRTTSASTGYDGASGSFNVLLNAVGETFEMADIGTTSYANMSLIFGIYKSTIAEDGSSLVVEVSSNGVNWTALTIPALPTGSGTAIWYSRTNTAGTIPAVTNLHIRFTGNTTAELRIDDVKLVYITSVLTNTDGQIASGGYAITSIVSDATSGLAVSNAYAPRFVIFNNLGQAVVSNNFATPFASGGATSATALSTNAPAAISTNLITLGTYTTLVYVTDADEDRTGDHLSLTSAPRTFVVVDDDTNPPIASSFYLQGSTTNFNLGAGNVAITGLLSDASGIQYTNTLTYVLLLDSSGTALESNALYAGSGSAATGTLFNASLYCGSDYTIKLYAADADLDRPGDHLGVTSVVTVIHTTGTGGPSDYPTASNLLVNGAAADPTVQIDDATINAGGWTLALTLTHSVGIFTNALSPSFRVTNTVGDLYGEVPWSNGVLAGTSYFFTNEPLPAATFAYINTGIQYVVWSASNQGSCVASIVDRQVITDGTNVFTVVDDDSVDPVLSAFTLASGATTLSVADASSGFAITGLVQDTGSGIAFTSQPPYFLFYDVDGSVLASNSVSGGTEGDGTSAIALTNWFAGLSLSCGNQYTVRVFAADADNDRPSDKRAVTGNVLVVTTEGVSGDAPAAQDLFVNTVPAPSASVFDELIATGGWTLAMTMTHSSGLLVTNGPNAPTFQIFNSSGTYVYAASPLTWSNIAKSGSDYYATNTPMPGGVYANITTGRYSVVWSAQSDGLCFGQTNGSSVVNPGTNVFTVVDDDTAPPNMIGLNVAGGTNGSGPGAGDCPDPTATNLNAGDIAIFAINTYTTGTPPNETNADSFAWVALVDLPVGTRIKFTDNGWKSSTASFRANEGIITWQATSCVPAGTVVRWIATNVPQLNVGRIVATNGQFAPNILGEQILAYQGSESSPNFIYAVNDRLAGIWDVDAVDTHSSAIPPGLIDGYTCVAVGEYDNIIINTNNLVLTGDRDQILYYIGDQDNWIGHDTNGVFDLLQFTFTFPDVNAGGGLITDQDVLLGTWSITGLVQDVGSGVMVSNNLGLRYVVMNTTDGQVVSNYFTTTFTNGTRTLQTFSNNVSPGTYGEIELGIYTAQIFAADVDNDRPFDTAERSTNVPFTVVDDDTDYPQIGYFYINGQTTITNPAELTSVVLSGQVRDVTSGIAFTSAPPSYTIYDSLGVAVLSGGFDYGPTTEGAGTTWTNIWTTNLDLSGIADCGTYTVRVSIADADNDRPDDRRDTNLVFLIAVASGSGDSPIATNLLVNAMPASVASLSDQEISTGGWSLAISIVHPSGVAVDPPDTPSFIVENAALTGVITQEWTNIVAAGNAIFATNPSLPSVAYASIDTGYYGVVWSARSLGACFGETNDSPMIDGDTNQFLVVDDDDTAPPPPTNVVSTAADWTNLTTVVVTWYTNGITDVSGVPGFRVTTNGLEVTNLSDGVFVGYTNRVSLTNLEEGVWTNWVFDYDADNDRPNDAAMGAPTGFVTYIDRTPPAQVGAFAAVAGANDDTSEIDMNWNALTDGGNSNLSPWYSYFIFYTDEASGPTATDAYVSVVNGLSTLGTNDTSSVTAGGFTFDTTYRVAIAGVDRAGNIGPLSSTQVVTLGSFILTQGLVSVQQRVDLSWTAAAGKTYDVIYVDALNFSDSLTSRWAKLGSAADSWLYDTGSLARVPPSELQSTMRFYRASLVGKWTPTAQPQRVVSREVYVARPLLLKEGQNFVSLCGVPDSNTVARVLGTNLLPAGPNIAETSTVISFYGAATNGQPRTETWWLSNAGHWMYSSGGVADDEPLPVYEGFNITIPDGVGSQRVVVVGRVPTTTVVRAIGPGTLGSNVFNLSSYTVPRRMKISETGLKESGLVGNDNGAYSDEIRVMPRGWGSPDDSQPKARLRLRSNGAWSYYSYSPSEFPYGPPAASEYMIEPDEAIIVIRRNGGTLSWTNKLYYTPPGRNMNP